jgi:hypothetical protein
MRAAEAQPGQSFTWPGIRHLLVRVSHPVWRSSGGGSGPARVVWTTSSINDGEELMCVLPDDDEVELAPGSWGLTAAQRRQVREAHAEARRTQMAGETGFGDWGLARLITQRDHLQSVLTVSAGQADRPQIREEYDAVCAEIARRAGESPDA